MKRIKLIPLFLVVPGLSFGCANDPYSQRRIELRTNHIKQTVADIERSENARAERLKSRGPEIDDWARRDAERFDKRSKMVGDYFW